VGSENCAQCHAAITRDFGTATHAHLKAEGPNAVNIGCETCHGAGSLHTAATTTQTIRETIVNPRKSPAICFQCHLDMQSRFSLPFHHPVPEGKLSCGDCHNPHKGSVVPGGGTELLTQNGTCFKCHTAQRGPFVFEHEATREGCLSCHEPHGSINQKLLSERNATACLKCHFQQQTAPGQLVIGGVNHSSFLSRGTCWSAGCHEAVHGSQVSATLRY
jgi:DmsE family decaheme c-type cytochrome